MNDNNKIKDLRTGKKPADDVAPKKKRKLWKTLLGVTAVLGLFGIIVGGVGLVLVLNHYGKGLPDYRQLADYEPAVMTRIHAGDGSLLTEFARQRRLFVPINAIPDDVIAAFLSAEDKNFYAHSGLDYLGILRAAITNVQNMGSGRPLVGASTITQQVARNFLLTLDQRLDRKIKEAILSLRIERAFTKDEILELYLNEVYFGYGAYGVASAALNYFNKSLDELDVEEIAYLAGILKGPSNYHPVRNYDRAIARRNWVLDRMEVNGYLTAVTADLARAEPLEVREREQTHFFRADYFGEDVRRQLYAQYGERGLYEGGMSVRTTLEPELQALAEMALRNGLVRYDRRHGWRGEITRISITGNWSDELGALDVPLAINSWRLAVVLDLSADGAVIGFEGGGHGFISLRSLAWARPWIEGERLGASVTDVTDVLSLGDVVAVEVLDDQSDARVLNEFLTDEGLPVGMVQSFGLRQIPEIEGGIIAMDPHTGRILAMVGGFNYETSQFNRATQAVRQPGSAFKPFVYAAAFEQGFTPSSLVLDAPFVMDQGFGLGMWKPRNSSNQFYGPSTLRLGMEKSRNLMTVRLAQYIGMDSIVDFAGRFHLADNLQPTLSMALGAGEVSLLQLTTAYGMLVNGGYHVTPTMIDRVQDRYGTTVYRHDERECLGCVATEWTGQIEPQISDNRERVVDARLAYQIVGMLQGVVQNGTGRSIRSLGIPLAGKTGTTNDAYDTWFVGFSPDLVVGVFVGFDRPRSLGTGEEGSSVSAPIFREFMGNALRGRDHIPFRIPAGIRLVRVNAETGLPAGPDDTNIILEAFIPGTEPYEMLVLDGANGFMQTDDQVRNGTGGLY